MSDIKIKESTQVEDNAEEKEEEKDWAAAKAFFEHLKTKKPRPVSTVHEFEPRALTLRICYIRDCDWKSDVSDNVVFKFMILTCARPSPA